MEKSKKRCLHPCDSGLDETGDYSCLRVGDLALGLKFGDSVEDVWDLRRKES